MSKKSGSKNAGKEKGKEKNETLQNDQLKSNQKGRKQENLSNRGYSEDQPGNPVRSTGSMKKARNHYLQENRIKRLTETSKK